MTDATPAANRRWLPLAAILLLVAIGAGGYLVWDQFVRGDDVAPIGFSSPSPGASVNPSASSEPSAEPSPSAPVPPSAGASSDSADADSLAGDWRVDPGSIVGYRVREKLGPVTAETDAVGRTEDVAGSATIVAAGESVQVTTATFEADVSTLASDDGRRDNRIRSIGLESSSFPTASFVLTVPVDVPPDALTGATVDVILTGDLTIHGVTKSEAIPAQARLVDGAIEVVGSITFPFSDFGMTPPTIGGFVTVADDATLEFRIVLGEA